MADTLPPQDDREQPLVTFALFAYNQERFIREAVEGAFAQTYEPLEIILSDDRSTDGTFEIMREMAVAYEGPHTIRLRQSRQNGGTLAHVLEVARQAEGHLMVMSAGDDISAPHRVAELAETWRRTGATALYSHVDVIGEDGRKLASDVRPQEAQDLLFWLQDRPRTFVPGAPSAYSTGFLSDLPLPPEPVFVEDIAISFALSIGGHRAERCELPLVAYRRNVLSATNNNTVGSLSDIASREKKAAVHLSANVALCDYCLMLLGSHGSARPHGAVAERILATRRKAENRLQFVRASALGRMYRMVRSGASDLAFCAPRLFGAGVFSVIKLAVNRLRAFGDRFAPSTGRAGEGDLSMPAPGERHSRCAR